MKILLSAFACAPGHGSEPDVGWGVVRNLSQEHQVWVITHTYHRRQIEPALQACPLANANFVYVGQSSEADEAPGVSAQHHPVFYLDYVRWQMLALRAAQVLVQTIDFDLVHHVTYANSWLPNFMGWLGPPFIWSAGGKDRTPRAFLAMMSAASRTSELRRDVAMRLLGGVTHYSTAVRARRILTASDPMQWASFLPVRRFPLGGIGETELLRLKLIPQRTARPFRIGSIGRLLGLKGFALAIRAFAQLRRVIPASEYWIIGSGPELQTLQELACRLGCSDSVHFTGWLPREQVLQLFCELDVLVHPSLHEQLGYVLLESMAAGRPVVCLAVGGPIEVVGTDAGILLPALSPVQVVTDLTAELERLALNPRWRTELGLRARERVEKRWTWAQVAGRLLDYYSEAVETPGSTAKCVP
jgi:glycosyltransferase involved in cell wall biosynthesis